MRVFKVENIGWRGTMAAPWIQPLTKNLTTNSNFPIFVALRRREDPQAGSQAQRDTSAGAADPAEYDSGGQGATDSGNGCCVETGHQRGERAALRRTQHHPNPCQTAELRWRNCEFSCEKLALILFRGLQVTQPVPENWVIYNSWVVGRVERFLNSLLRLFLILACNAVALR